MKIAKETQERVNRVYNTSYLEMSIDHKKVWLLGEIAVLLAGLLDAKLAELGMTDED